MVEDRSSTYAGRQMSIARIYTEWKGNKCHYYLCYKEPKSPYTFLLILIFNELFKFKISDERQY